MAARSRESCAVVPGILKTFLLARNVFAAEFKLVGAFVSSLQLLNNYRDSNYVFTKTLILKQVMVVCKSK
jgi:hypothetical protein